MNKKKLGLIAASAVALLAALAGVLPTTASARTDATATTTVLCGAYDAAETGNGTYVVQNDVWNTETGVGSQCVSVDTDGFTITQATHTLPADHNPASYPDVYYGCSYGWCTPWDVKLPLAVSTQDFANLTSSFTATLPTSSTDIWDLSYDIWFDPTTQINSRPTGLELMVWENRNGGVRPGGTQIASGMYIEGNAYEVWYDSTTAPPMLSFVRQNVVTSATMRVSDFYEYAVAKGYASEDWYNTSVQLGYELWTGGTGGAVNTFTTGITSC